MNGSKDRTVWRHVGYALLSGKKVACREYGVRKVAGRAATAADATVSRAAVREMIFADYPLARWMESLAPTRYLLDRWIDRLRYDFKDKCGRIIGLRNDGAYHGAYAPRQLRDDPVPASRAALRFGDERKIARIMRTIDALGRRNGRTVVFFIHPVYAVRRGSQVDDIMTRALHLIPDLKIVDHRGRFTDAGYFFNYDHPGPAYYRALIGELRARDWLGAP